MEDKATQTDYVFFDCYSQSREEEIFFPCLDDGTIVYYESEDPFLRDYYNSYYKWEKDGARFLNENFVKEYISTGEIPIMNDGRPELEEWFKYTLNTGVFIEEWGFGRIKAKEFTERMLNVFNEHGNIPDYLSTQSHDVIQLSELYPQDQ